MGSNPQISPKETSTTTVPTYRTSGTLALPAPEVTTPRLPKRRAPAPPIITGEQHTPPETATLQPQQQSQQQQNIEAQKSEPKRSPKTTEPKSKSTDIKDELPVIKSESPRQLVYRCNEIKRKMNYGTRILPTTNACEHIQIDGPNCERCCRPISWNNSVLSLHCGWHHQFLHCSTCKLDITEHVVYEGLPYCSECYSRIIGDHASQMATKHTHSK